MEMWNIGSLVKLRGYFCEPTLLILDIRFMALALDSGGRNDSDVCSASMEPVLEAWLKTEIMRVEDASQRVCDRRRQGSWLRLGDTGTGKDYSYCERRGGQRTRKAPLLAYGA